MQKKLKPCPLCGNKKIYVSMSDGWHPYLVICCDSVDCCLIADFDYDVQTEEEAIKRWNRRPGKRVIKPQ